MSEAINGRFSLPMTVNGLEMGESFAAILQSDQIRV